MKDIDINYIRTLVERYFDGSATKEETDALRRIAANADNMQVADRKLLADLELVKSLDGYSEAFIGRSASDTPDALTAKIEKHIGSLAVVERRRAFRKRIWSSVAALFVIAVLAVAIVMRRPSENVVAGGASCTDTAEEQILKIEIPGCPSQRVQQADLFAFADNGGNELTVYLPGICTYTSDDFAGGCDDMTYIFEDFEPDMYIEPDDIIVISI